MAEKKADLMAGYLVMQKGSHWVLSLVEMKALTTDDQINLAFHLVAMSASPKQKDAPMAAHLAY